MTASRSLAFMFIFLDNLIGVDEEFLAGCILLCCRLFDPVLKRALVL
jgi:hypothetical protein